MAIQNNLHGSTLTFPARSGLLFQVISGALPELSAKEYDDTDLVSPIAKMAASPVIDPGDLGFVVRFDPLLAIPIGGADEVVRITLPLLTGQSVAGKYEFLGHVNKKGGEKATPDGRSETTVNIRINSLPIFTAGT